MTETYRHAHTLHTSSGLGCSRNRKPTYSTRHIFVRLSSSCCLIFFLHFHIQKFPADSQFRLPEPLLYLLHHTHGPHVISSMPPTGRQFTTPRSRGHNGGSLSDVRPYKSVPASTACPACYPYFEVLITQSLNIFDLRGSDTLHQQKTQNITHAIKSNHHMITIMNSRCMRSNTRNPRLRLYLFSVVEVIICLLICRYLLHGI